MWSSSRISRQRRISILSVAPRSVFEVLYVFSKIIFSSVVINNFFLHSIMIPNERVCFNLNHLIDQSVPAVGKANRCRLRMDTQRMAGGLCRQTRLRKPTMTQPMPHVKTTGPMPRYRNGKIWFCQGCSQYAAHASQMSEHKIARRTLPEDRAFESPSAFFCCSSFARLGR